MPACFATKQARLDVQADTVQGSLVITFILVGLVFGLFRLLLFFLSLLSFLASSTSGCCEASFLPDRARLRLQEGTHRVVPLLSVVVLSIGPSCERHRKNVAPFFDLHDDANGALVARGDG